ncbi:hypothetical protein LC607_11475 [Nostoc sp. CHAB 5824]|nr:hypothetical protein [Nostoc sp. CHAB 5824]
MLDKNNGNSQEQWFSRRTKPDTLSKYDYNRSKLQKTPDRCFGGFRASMPFNIVIYEYAFLL